MFLFPPSSYSIIGIDPIIIGIIIQTTLVYCVRSSPQNKQIIVITRRVYLTISLRLFYRVVSNLSVSFYVLFRPSSSYSSSSSSSSYRSPPFLLWSQDQNAPLSQANLHLVYIHHLLNQSVLQFINYSTRYRCRSS